MHKRQMYVWSRPLSTPPLNSAWPISPSKAGKLRLAQRPASAYYQKTTVTTSAYHYISFAGFLLTPPGGQSQTFGKTTQL